MQNEEDIFKIYIDRLSSEPKKIEASILPSFIDIQESEVIFPEPVRIQGEAFVLEKLFVLRLAIETPALMPCALCNCETQVKIAIGDFCFSEAIGEIKGRIFNFKEILREEILLALPMRVECHEGSCPERGNLAQFLNKNQEN